MLKTKKLLMSLVPFLMVVNISSMEIEKDNDPGEENYVLEAIWADDEKSNSKEKDNTSDTEKDYKAFAMCDDWGFLEEITRNSKESNPSEDNNHDVNLYDFAHNPTKFAALSQKEKKSFTNYLFKMESIQDPKLKIFHIAAQCGATQYLEELIAENPADIEAVDSEGLTPVMHAAKDLTCLAAKLLISKGADLNVRDKKQQCLYIHAAAQSNEKLVKVLLKNNAAASLEFFEVAFKTISERDSATYEGTGIDNLDQKIYWASVYNCFEFFEKNWAVIKYRINNGIEGISEEVNSSGKNTMVIMPLLDAVQYNRKTIIETLLKLGADVKVQGKQFGNTALHVAVKTHNLELVKLFIASGVKHLENFEKQTPLALALSLKKELSQTNDQEIIDKNAEICKYLISLTRRPGGCDSSKHNEI